MTKDENISASEGKFCLYSYDSNQWQPGKVTTYILAVNEIELIVQKLEEKLSDVNTVEGRDDDGAALMANISRQVTNWNTVLQNYRNHTKDSVEMFHAEREQFNKLVNSYKDFTKSQREADWEFVGSHMARIVGGLANYLPSLLIPLATGAPGPGPTTAYPEVASAVTSIAFATIFESIHKSLYSHCSKTIPFYDTSIGNNICGDFKEENWNFFADAIRGSCGMPGTPEGESLDTDDGSSSSSLDAQTVMHTVCRLQKGDSSITKYIPGGVEKHVTGYGLLGFLQDKDTLLTFSGQTSMDITYTSTITDSITTKSEMYESRDTFNMDVAFSKEGKLNPVSLKAGNKANANTETDISLGRVFDSSHGSERTIEIHLEDPDQGVWIDGSLFVSCIVSEEVRVAVMCMCIL